MQHRILFPILFKGFNGQSPEKILLPLEICLHRADQKALPEPPRPDQEIVAPGLDKFVYLLGLVYIAVPSLRSFSKFCIPTG